MNFYRLPILVNIIGDYKFEEGSGTALANAPGKLLPSATLSSPPPTWNSVSFFKSFPF